MKWYGACCNSFWYYFLYLSKLDTIAIMSNVCKHEAYSLPSGTGLFIASFTTWVICTAQTAEYLSMKVIIANVNGDDSFHLCPNTSCALTATSGTL